MSRRDFAFYAAARAISRSEHHRRHTARIERGAVIAKRTAAIVFRIVVAVLFLPVAFACFARDDSFGGWCAVAVVFILAPLMAPMPEE